MPGWNIGAEELADLAGYLRARGYSVGAEELLDAQRLLFRMAEQGVSKPAEDLGPWLSPVFATSPRDSDRFSDLYREWREMRDIPKRKAAADSSAQGRRGQRLLWVSIVVLVAALGVGLWRRLHEPPQRTDNIPSPGPPGPSGSSGATGPTGTSGPLRAPDFATAAGTLVGSDGKPVARARILAAGTSTESGADGSFTVTGRVGTPILATDCDYDAALFPLQASADLHPVMVRKDTPGCIAGSGPAAPEDPRPRYARLRVAVSASPVAALLLWTAYVLWKRVGLRKWRNAASLRFARAAVGEGSSGLFAETEIQRSVVELRRAHPTSLQDLWPEPTVAATVERAGWFTPVYRARRRTAEYLVLIDRRNRRDQQAAFATELIEILKARGVIVNVYYFNGDPRTCSEPVTGNPFRLTDLTARFGAHPVWIVAESASLFSSFTGRLERWTDAFQQWPSRVLLTPTLPSDWGTRELALADAGFEVIPATPRGLARVDRYLANPEFTLDTYPESLEDGTARWTGSELPNKAEVARLLTELRLYLGGDGFRWLAACAEYPAIEWAIVLYLGRALVPPATFETTLRKMVRLPWFRRGMMPDWLRTELVGRDPKLRTQARGLLAKRLAGLAESDGKEAGRSTVEVAVERDHRRKVEEDEVWLSLLWGRNAHDLALPAAGLRRLVFRKGRAWLGPRLGALAAGALLLSAGIWWAMGFGAPTFTPQGPDLKSIALDVAISQWHDSAYYTTDAGFGRGLPKVDARANFSAWVYDVTALLTGRAIRLVPFDDIVRGAATPDGGIEVGGGFTLYGENGRPTPRPSQARASWLMPTATDGALPDFPPVPVPSTRPPAAIDWSSLMPPVMDTGNEAGVFGFALAAAMDFQLRSNQPKVLVSPRHIYYLARKDRTRDTGAVPQDAIDALEETGVVADSVWPYHPGEFAAPPPAEVEHAAHYRIEGAAKLAGLDKIREALVVGPIVAAFDAGDSMSEQPTNSTGVLPMPSQKRPDRGGTMVCITGYDDRARRFKFINSWGTDWGDRGYGYLPYDYPGVEFWTIGRVVTEAASDDTTGAPGVVFKRSFLESIRNRATLTTEMTIDRAQARPNPPRNDGDFQMAGRAPAVGLPFVAEIMNGAAAENRDALDLIHKNAASGEAVTVTGAWRLWAEHPPVSQQVQFAAVAPAATTNPDHYFELHPVLWIGQLELRQSLRPVEGFEPKDATAAFGSYEKLTFSADASRDLVRISTRTAGYNYVQFLMSLNPGGVDLSATPEVVSGRALDSAGNAVSGSIRFVLPHEGFLGARRGDIEVLGIPRWNVDAILTQLDANGGKPITDRKLPYEIIIVGVYPRGEKKK